MPRKKILPPMRVFRFTCQECSVIDADGKIHKPKSDNRTEKYFHVSRELLQVGILFENGVENGIAEMVSHISAELVIPLLITKRKRKEVTMPGATKPGNP